MKGFNYCDHCMWFNALTKKCEKPKGEGFCYYTKSNL